MLVKIQFTFHIVIFKTQVEIAFRHYFNLKSVGLKRVIVQIFNHPA